MTSDRERTWVLTGSTASSSAAALARRALGAATWSLPSRGAASTVRARIRNSQWREVIVLGAAMLLGSIVPLPARRRFGSFGPDKWIHLAIHAWFAAALRAALLGSLSDPDDREGVVASALALVGSVGYGIGTELLQDAVPGRRGECADVAASVLGSCAGVLLGHVFPDDR